ncbi:MAG TPA: flagellar hook-basal body complex protein FliE [Longimicrobiales bacterium]|nr:flagellar hook-basal body complex protein FliE [Longimicrobiales bacterium]
MAITGVGAAQAAAGVVRTEGGVPLRLGAQAGGPSFAETLKGALGEVSELRDRAGDAIGAFVRGEAVEIHEVMAAAEEAGIALDLLIEIRNKLADAYRSVIQMQS